MLGQLQSTMDLFHRQQHTKIWNCNQSAMESSSALLGPFFHLLACRLICAHRLL